MAAENLKRPWKNGYYKMKNLNSMVFLVEGEQVQMEPVNGERDEEHAYGTWKFGEFEEARDEIKDDTGKTNYNVDMEMWKGMWKTKGIVNDDGTRITMWTFANKLDHFEYMSDEELSAFKEFGDPATAPSCHYEIRPEHQGRLLWVSGAPGLGKSTTGLILSKTAGYVYYEADAFGQHLNPYIPPDADEPTLATSKQKPLKGVPQDRLDAVQNGMKDLMKLIKGEEYSEEYVKGYYTALCKDIKTEKKRIGGDWVVAQAVPTRSLRDHIRKQFGPDLVFVVFNMTKEEQKKRIQQRHGGSEDVFVEWLAKVFDIFEPAQEDETNVIDVVVTGDMSREDVTRKVLSMLP